MRGRMGTRYEFMNEFAQPVEPVEGHSSYFSTPSDTLDPRVFIEGTDKMRPEIREELLQTLYDFWDERYEGARSWSEVWIAGSAVSQSWSEGPDGKGDLDVLLGIDMPVFFQHNPSMKSFSEKVVARHMNNEFREELWPQLADYRGGEFEVTFYVNPSTGRDIRRINPYAAYNLRTDTFDVPPVELPEDWGEQHVPREWWPAIQAEIHQAHELVERYNALARELAHMPEGTPQRVNTAARLDLVVDQATALYEGIHADRRNAYQGRFGVPGQGFFDFYNFRWQQHKSHGTGAMLNSIRGVGRKVEEQRQTARYGSPVASDVLTPATLQDYT